MQGVVFSPGEGSEPSFFQELSLLLNGSAPAVIANRSPLFQPDTAREEETKQGQLTALELLERAAGEGAAVLSTGRLTELALFFLAYPKQACRFWGIYAAGGAVYGGDRTPAAEASFYEDPEAAQIMVDHAAGMHLLPLETAEKCTAVLWDHPVPAPGLGLMLCMMDQQAVREEEHTLQVDLESALSRGCSVIDWLNRDKQLPRHRICVDLDSARFRPLAERACTRLTKGGGPRG